MNASMDANKEPELVEIDNPTRSSNCLWVPNQGEETLSLLDVMEERGLSKEERSGVLKEAYSVLSKCAPPESEEERTGLVIGYVQSGKTLSFTTLSALAHDNGYGLIIVLAGRTTNLLEQASERLGGSLGRGFESGWRHVDSNDLQNIGHQRIQAALKTWNSDSAPVEETVLLTVMKERHHLERLIGLLEELDLEETSTIVIDDEADQASLNTQASRDTDEVSSTYRRLLRIRELLPHHTYLQYTATPQALLLISIADELSPDFTEVLTPGGEYTGGVEFFNEQNLIQSISEAELPSNLDNESGPPDSLLSALKFFFLGVAAARVQSKQIFPSNMSMMVHPHRRTVWHQQYKQWIDAVKDRWCSELGLDEGHPDRVQLISDFHEVYSELEQTAGVTLPPLDEVVDPDLLRWTLRTTPVWEVNSREGATPTVDWNSDYAHILVGATVLDRGYTIEGLTTSYMPRGSGVGNADTIQQRARWFGYKENYLGYCRVFLPQEMVDAYNNYVEHEQDVRQGLINHIKSGKSLRQWRRRFILDSSLRPTRRNVLETGYARVRSGSGWFQPRAPHKNERAVVENQHTVQEFINQHGFLEVSVHEEAGAIHKHEKAEGLNLREVREQLLVDFRHAWPRDSSEYTRLLLQLDRYLNEHPEAECTVYRMSPNVERSRGTGDGDAISELFQGAAPVEPEEERGRIYPGDSKIREDDQLTIQIHTLNVYRGSARQPNPSRLIRESVPALAIWSPRSVMSSDMVIQHQPEQG